MDFIEFKAIIEEIILSGNGKPFEFPCDEF